MINTSNGLKILRLIFLILISAILLMCIESTVRVYDTDLWVHLKYGEHFVLNHTWSIDHSVFSWTPANREWKYVTWIGSSIMYLIYNYISLDAVMLLPFITLISILLVYALFLRSIGMSFTLMTMSLFFIAAVFFYMPVVKPAVLSSLLFATCLAIYYSSLHNHNKSYWALPPLFLVWVNTHGAFFFGLFFLCLAFATQLLISWHKGTLQSEKVFLRGLGISILLSFLILGINPHGFGYFTGIIRDMLHIDSFDPALYISEYSSLWRSLDGSQNLGSQSMSWAGIFMLSTYALLTFWEIKKGRHPDFIKIILLLVFFTMGMLYVRLFVFYCLVWLFSITELLITIRPLYSSPKLSLIALALACYFIVNQLSLHIMNGESIRPFQHSVEGLYPISASIFIKQHALPPQLINDYVTGGYLLWALYPEYKVFVDPRAWPYQKDILTDCFALEKSTNEVEVRAILKKYPEARTAIFNLAFKPLTQVFMQMHDWRMIYFDETVAIFVQTIEPQSNITLDTNPQRFSELHRPVVLTRLFNLYISLADKKDAQVIRNYYQNNVSNSYLFKNSQLIRMDINLNVFKTYRPGLKSERLIIEDT